MGCRGPIWTCPHATVWRWVCERGSPFIATRTRACLPFPFTHCQLTLAEEAPTSVKDTPGLPLPKESGGTLGLRVPTGGWACPRRGETWCDLEPNPVLVTVGYSAMRLSDVFPEVAAGLDAIGVAGDSVESGQSHPKSHLWGYTQLWFLPCDFGLVFSCLTSTPPHLTLEQKD